VNSLNRQKEGLKMNKTIVGKLTCGTDNPLLNKEVELEILLENVGNDGKQTFVRTVKKHLMPCYSLNIETGEEKRWTEMQYYEGWLIND
jgi:hypothetical protein